MGGADDGPAGHVERPQRAGADPAAHRRPDRRAGGLTGEDERTESEQRDEGPRRLLDLRQWLVKNAGCHQGEREPDDGAPEADDGAQEAGARAGDGGEREQDEHEKVEGVHRAPKPTRIPWRRPLAGPAAVGGSAGMQV